MNPTHSPWNLRKAARYLTLGTMVCFITSFALYRASPPSSSSGYFQSIVSDFAGRANPSVDINFDEDLRLDGVEVVELHTKSANVLVEAAPGASAHYRVHARFPVKSTSTGVVNVPGKFDTSQYFHQVREGNRLKLTLDDQTDDPSGFRFDTDETQSHLTLALPATFVGQLILQSVSGNLDAGSIEATALTANSVSGNIGIQGLRLKTFFAITVSGNLKFDGQAGLVEGKSTSGDLNLTLANQPASVRATSVSGDLRVRFPNTPDAQYTVHTVSGDVEFPKAWGVPRDEDSSRKSISGKVGKGTGLIEAKSVSGDIQFE